MKRRDFFTRSSAALMGGTLLAPSDHTLLVRRKAKTAKNIIFMVSDGMSTGTLNMADMLMQRKEGRKNQWIDLYRENRGRRAFMETSSSNALVTDSAAGSSAWGGGRKVPNGSLNVNADGTFNKPILQKFKAAGKSVGCVTSVTITHATPAGFCINNQSRGDESDIARQYLDLKFDVMMGGGTAFFTAEKRKDKADLFGEYQKAGYAVLRDRDGLMGLKDLKKPVMGVYCESALPYAIDHAQSDELKKSVPSLAEMSQKSIELLSANPKGFVMQIEGGKVDWAAHSNDTGGLLYDQIAFDDAIRVALDFAEKDKETLVIITTDHGNANPGLFGSDEQFDRIQHFRHSNNWILSGIEPGHSAAQVIERIAFAQGYAIKKAEAEALLDIYNGKGENGIYNPKKLPNKQLALIQSAYTGVAFASTDHSADYVELAMFGPGSELLSPFVKNTDLHNLMLEASDMVRI